MDVLRHGEQVEVLGPADLRRKVMASLKQALDIYEPSAHDLLRQPKSELGKGKQESH
jgi:hypothetical protein